MHLSTLSIINRKMREAVAVFKTAEQSLSTTTASGFSKPFNLIQSHISDHTTFCIAI